jgi:hypothetical protein
MKKGFEHWFTNMVRSEDEIEQLGHGETVTKFVATDEPNTTENDDVAVEIHGFRTGSGTLIITHEVLYRRQKEKKSGECEHLGDAVHPGGNLLVPAIGKCTKCGKEMP